MPHRASGGRGARARARGAHSPAPLHASVRSQTLAYIGRAVALRLEVDDPPVPEHVRASLPQRVHQVCELALSHAEQQASLAQAAEHAVDDASGMQL